MKKEIELKFRVDDFTQARKKLHQEGAVLEWKGIEQNWFFDTPRRDLRKRDAALRIKIVDDTRITLKEKQPEQKGMKVADEYQVTVDDAKTMREIFERIGFVETLHYRKRREHWILGNIQIELDELSPSHRYVEIEASIPRIKNLARKLNLDLAKSTTKTYIQLVKELNIVKKPR